MSEKVPPVYIDPKRIVYGALEPGKHVLSIHKNVMKNTIFLYWWCSETNEWKYFPFNKIFSELRRFLYWRIALFFGKKYIKDIGEQKLSRSEYDDLRERAPHKTPPLEAVWKIEHADTLSEKIRAFDTVIHIEHGRGNLLFNKKDVIPHLRNEYENRYGRYV